MSEPTFSRRDYQGIVLFGVCGSGKTTVAQELSQLLGEPHLEGDSFHPQSNINKMVSGIPLDDEDRWPWLNEIAGAIKRRVQLGEFPIVACSALKASYRDFIVEKSQCRILYIFLDISKNTSQSRLRGRNHFMPTSLVDSQFATLEKPHRSEAVIVPECNSLENCIREIWARVDF